MFEGTFKDKLKQGKGITYGEKQKITAMYEDDLKHGPYEIVSNDGNYE